MSARIKVLAAFFILHSSFCILLHAQERVIQKATQTEVNAGLNNTKFVTPLTLQNKPGSGGGVTNAAALTNRQPVFATGPSAIASTNPAAFRLMTGSLGTTTENATNMTFLSTSGGDALSLSTLDRQAHDSQPIISIDWQLRRLYDDDGGVALDWKESVNGVVGRLAAHTNFVDVAIASLASGDHLAYNASNGTWTNGPSGGGGGGTTAYTVLTQNGTNAGTIDFSGKAYGSAWYITLTNTLFIGTPANIPATPYSWTLYVQQPSTGTCLVTFTNATFSWPEGAAPIATTNGSAVDIYTFVNDPFTNTLLHGVLSPNMRR